jgi:hypothetical protein
MFEWGKTIHPRSRADQGILCALSGLSGSLQLFWPSSCSPLVMTFAFSIPFLSTASACGTAQSGN